MQILFASVSYHARSCGFEDKYEIVARISLASNNRPTLRTGVYVKKEYFKTVRTNGHGEIKDIVIPRQTAFNREDVNDVKLAKRELELWSCRFS